MNELKDFPLILASKSPRRSQILKDAGFNFTVKVKEVEETYPPTLTADQIPVHIAKQKAEAVKEEVQEDNIVICADTIVYLNGKVYGKPSSSEKAVQFLKDLSGKAHYVITGVCIVHGKKEILFSEQTIVSFKNLSEEEIRYYVDKYQPMDKAGAYAIQEWIGMVGIYKIEGCYFNVMGLPMSRVYDELKTLTAKI